MVLPAAWRGSKDRSNDGVVCAAVLPAQPRHLHQLGHMLRSLVRHHHAEHLIAQPVGEGQADCRAVHIDEQVREHFLFFINPVYEEAVIQWYG